ncbi:hypothetical protein FACS189472_17620 [Alphaproteobacteria bacterium]|nr:hypothetical protein FACS189472_17620 [Alphaproteobacteria bacterium]
MNSFKNNMLDVATNEKLCEIPNAKRYKKKSRLLFSKSYHFAKSYHPLKGQKVKLNKINFIRPRDINCNDNKNDNQVLTKRYKPFPLPPPTKSSIWTDESKVLEWLISIGVQIKRISTKEYFLTDRLCSINHVLVFANKKRIDLGLPPFYMEGLTEF